MYKRLVSIFLLTIFSYSISVFSAEIHFCKGEMTDISFFGDTSCACPSMSIEKKHKCAMHKKKKSCCETKEISHDRGDDFDAQSFYVGIDLEITAVLLSFDYSYLWDNSEERDRDLPVYVPPGVTRDFTILFQSFLI